MAQHANRRRQSAARYPRTARVNELIREVLGETLERDGDDDPRLELVTITGVETTSDLAHATIYFSALGTKASLNEVTDALMAKRLILQKAIANNSTFKRTPQLRFLPDSGIIEGQKIEDLIKDLPPIKDQPDLDDLEDL